MAELARMRALQGEHHAREAGICYPHSGALAAPQFRAQTHADAAIEALAALPESEYRDALAGLAEYAVSRTS
jgi:octaprenyl-diphosphate synthase